MLRNKQKQSLRNEQNLFNENLELRRQNEGLKNGINKIRSEFENEKMRYELRLDGK